IKNSFSVDSNSISLGQSTNLNWTTSNCDTVVVSDNQGNSSLSTDANSSGFSVSPTTSTIYTLTVTGTNAPSAQDITLTVTFNPPVADFSADLTTPLETEIVNFTDTSSNTPTSWSWNFGDGDTSNLQDPLHAY